MGIHNSIRRNEDNDSHFVQAKREDLNYVHEDHPGISSYWVDRDDEEGAEQDQDNDPIMAQFRDRIHERIRRHDPRNNS